MLGTGFNSWKSGNTGTVTLLKSYGTTFPTRDGQWVAFMPNPVRWEAFAQWYREVMEPLQGEGYGMGPEEWNDPTYRVNHREDSNNYFHEFCAAVDRDELVTRGQEGRHYATPVQTVADIAADPHLAARDFFPQVDHPALGRALPKPRSPYRLSRVDIDARPAPGLGEHTQAILESLRDGSLTPRAGSAKGRDGDLPLSGYRVLDFCWMAAGPLITELLGNLGADIVKVESATGIDQVREFVHPPKASASIPAASSPTATPTSAHSPSTCTSPRRSTSLSGSYCLTSTWSPPTTPRTPWPSGASAPTICYRSSRTSSSARSRSWVTAGPSRTGAPSATACWR